MFRPIEQKKFETSLAVPDYFATLVELRNNDYHVSLDFNINRSEVEAKKLTKIKIKVSKKSYQEIQRVSDNNFLTKNLEAFRKSKSRESSKILEETISLTDTLKSANRKRRVLIEVNSPNFEKQLQNFRSPPTDFFTLRDKNLSIIKDVKLDPAEAIMLSDIIIANSNITTLKNHYLFNSINSLTKDRKYYSAIESNSSQNKLYINKIIKIPERYKNEQLEVTFELYTDSNPYALIFEERKKTFSIQDLLSIKNSIIEKPSIKESYAKIGLSGLFVNQLDEKASGIQVLKKTINSNDQVSRYATVFKKEKFVKNINQKIEESNSLSEIQIYRCVAYNSDPGSKVFSAYRNIIVGTIPFIDPTIMLITDNQQQKAIEITIKNPPPEATEFQILKRKILKDSFGSFEDYREITKFLTIKPVPQKVFDYDVKHGEYYEYSVKYKLNSRTIKHSISKIHKFVDSSSFKSISVNISEYSLTSSNTGPVISFSINSNIVQEKNNLILAAINQAGIGERFQKEFEKIKDKFQDIVFFKVTRTNLSISPAIEEEFKDVITGGQFIDSPETRKNSGVSDINLNHDYLYEIRGYYKNPASLMKDLVLTIPSQIKVGTGSSKKTYRYKPYKWLQQKVLTSGTLIAEDANGNLLQPSFLEDGDIGIVANIKVDKLETLLEIKSAIAKRTDIKTVFINWKIDASLEEYDHFVIVKESNGKRAILATTHNLKYADVIKLSDVGTIIYYITPVYNDYSVGPTIRTNSIVVNPEEFDGSIK